MKPKILYNKVEDTNVISKINTSFQNIFFEIGEIDFGGKIYIFFIKFKNKENLELEWNEFNSFITATFISKIKDDFSKWNTYVFYLSNEEVSKSLKYEIENDRFSTRKIVIDNEERDFNEDLFNEIISDHIINDIEIVVGQKNKEHFIKDKVIEKALETDNISEILEEIKKSIQNENKES